MTTGSLASVIQAFMVASVAFFLAPVVVAIVRGWPDRRFLAVNLVVSWIGFPLWAWIGSRLLRFAGIDSNLVFLGFLPLYVVPLYLFVHRYEAGKARWTAGLFHLNVVVGAVALLGALFLFVPNTSTGPNQLEPDMLLEDVTCANKEGKGVLMVRIVNSGETAYDLSSVRLNVYNDTTHGVNYTLSRTVGLHPQQVQRLEDVALLRRNASWPNPGSRATYQLNGTVFQPGMYRIEVSLPAPGQVSDVSDTARCTVSAS